MVLSAQSILVSVTIGTYDDIYVFLRLAYFEMGLLFDERRV
jgi:hypothetical protein